MTGTSGLVRGIESQRRCCGHASPRLDGHTFPGKAGACKPQLHFPALMCKGPHGRAQIGLKTPSIRSGHQQVSSEDRPRLQFTHDGLDTEVLLDRPTDRRVILNMCTPCSLPL